MTLENSETWSKAKSKIYDKHPSFKLEYWENHSLGLLCAFLGVSESELIKSALIEKINRHGYSFDDTPKRLKSEPRSFFAILQELLHKVSSEQKLRRMAIAVLKANGRLPEHPDR